MRMLKRVKESNFFWGDDNDHSSLDDLGPSLYEDEIKALDKEIMIKYNNIKDALGELENICEDMLTLQGVDTSKSTVKDYTFSKEFNKCSTALNSAISSLYDYEGFKRMSDEDWDKDEGRREVILKDMRKRGVL